MKHIALLILAALLAFCSALPLTDGSLAARADEKRYAQAAVQDAYFYDKKDGASVFAVPYTYYVEVLSEDGEWYYARYAADTGAYREKLGYCLKKDFVVVKDAPAVPYLYKTVTVTYTADVSAGALPVLNELALEAAYYGAYQAGGDWYSYVYCQGSFGYIAGANKDYPLNELYSEEGEKGEESENKEPERKGLSAGLISAIIIAALFIAVILMLHFTSKKSPKDA